MATKIINLNENPEDYKNNNFKKDEVDFKELFNGVLRKRKWTYVSSTILFIIISSFSIHQRIFNPLYRGAFTILIKDPLEKNEKDKSLKNDGLSFSQGFSNTNFSKTEINTLIRLLKSPSFLRSVAKEYNINPNALSSLIKIDQPSFGGYRNSEDVLNVSLTIKDKKEGLKVLTSLSKLFLEESLLRKQQQLKDGLNFLKKESPNIRKKESLLQSKLVAFREDNNLIDPEVEGNALKQQQNIIEQKIINLKSDNKRLENVKKEILNGTISARGFQEELGDGLLISDFDQSLLTQLITVEKEIAVARSKYTSNSSVIKSLKSRLKKIQPLLLKNQLEAVDTAINLKTGRLANNLGILKDIQIKFQTLPKLIKEYKKLEQELLFANQNLVNLNSSIANYQLGLAQSNIPWRIISEPKMNPIAIKPSMKKNLFNGFFLSILFGIIVALIRDRFDHFYHNSEEVQESTNQPIIGYLPFINLFSSLRNNKELDDDFLEYLQDLNSSKNKKILDPYKRFFFTESLRSIYTSINFLNTDKKLKSLMISSSIPKEGKTLINILLAKTISDMGQKVLIIDADMRKPAIHKRLNMDNLIGLSNLLIDNDIKLEKVIQSSDLFKDVDIITAGIIPPDPIRLLNSDRFSSILNELNQLSKYDLILFDTPPIIGLSDTLIISKKVGGVIIISGIGSTDRSLLKLSINRIKSTKCNLLGIITNSTKDSSSNLVKYNYGNYSYKGYQEYSTYSNYADIEEEDISNQKNDLNDVSKLNNFIFKLKNLISSFRSTLFKWLDE